MNHVYWALIGRERFEYARRALPLTAPNALVIKRSSRTGTSQPDFWQPVLPWFDHGASAFVHPPTESVGKHR